MDSKPHCRVRWDGADHRAIAEWVLSVGGQVQLTGGQEKLLGNADVRAVAWDSIPSKTRRGQAAAATRPESTAPTGPEPTAATEPNSIAQGAALDSPNATILAALKGRDSRTGTNAANESRPVGATEDIHGDGAPVDAIRLASFAPKGQPHNSPGQRPGLDGQPDSIALKGRHNFVVSWDLSRPCRASTFAESPNPGQRPGLVGQPDSIALKGRHNLAVAWDLSRPCRASTFVESPNPGRCPGLLCDRPVGAPENTPGDRAPGLSNPALLGPRPPRPGVATTTTGIANHEEAKQPMPAVGHEPDSCVPADDGGINEEGSGVRFFGIGGEKTSPANRAHLPPISKNPTPDPADWPDPERFAVAPIASAPTGRNSIALVVPYISSNATNYARIGPLAPVLRGEGWGEGPSKDARNPLTPSPSPRSTGARGAFNQDRAPGLRPGLSNPAPLGPKPARPGVATTTDIADHAEAKQPMPAVGHEPDSCVPVDDGGVNEEGSGVRFFGIGGETTSPANRVHLPPISKNPTPDPADWPDPERFAVAPIASAPTGRNSIALVVPYISSNATNYARIGPLAPVLRGEGWGEGPSKDARNPLTPSPSPRSTGARGAFNQDRAPGLRRVLFGTQCAYLLG